MKKSDIIIPEFPCNIQVGSKVVFIDGSYTLSIINKELKHISLGLSDEIYTVIAINVTCPSEASFCDGIALQYLNNCIVCDDNGGIHFCSKINIKNIECCLRDKGDRIVYKSKN